MKKVQEQVLAILCSGGLLAGLALWWASSTSKAEARKVAARQTVRALLNATPQMALAGEDWIGRVMARVTGHEGGYASVNPNKDGAGLSFGILQWSQQSGSLGSILARMNQADPGAFASIFGLAWHELLTTTKAASKAPVQGVVLWAEPWLSRFRAAGAHPAYQQAQRQLATQGAHFQAALDVADLLSVSTERAIALFFDTAVQQGPNKARSLAKSILAEVVQSGVPTIPYEELLRRFAEACAAPYLRRGQPSRLQPDPNRPEKVWKKVGAEWHLFAGSIDLYRNIRKRREGILADPALLDVEVLA